MDKKLTTRGTVRVRLPKGYWTLALLRAEALKYATISGFQKGSRGAYDVAWRDSLIDKVCAHMTRKCALNGTYTKMRLAEIAAGFNYRQDFRLQASSAYQVAARSGWLDEICAHMAPGLYGFDRTKPAILYYYEINGLYKLGITNRTVKQRVGSQYAEIRVLARKRFKIGADAAEAERAIRNYVDDCHRYDGPPVLNENGDTELYTCDILGLDT